MRSCPSVTHGLAIPLPARLRALTPRGKEDVLPLSMSRGTPGERRASESSPAFEAFVLYRDLGPSRSINSVARELHKSASLIGRWSAKYRWIERVDEWDRHQDERRRAAESAAIDQMSHRHADAVQVQIQALMAPATALVRRLEEDPALLSKLETKELAHLVSVRAAAIEALGSGTESAGR